MSTEENTPEVNEIAEATEATTAEGANLSLNDIVLMVNVINAGAKRGTFTATEFETVGALHTRLVAFLRAAGVIKDEEAGEAAEADAE